MDKRRAWGYRYEYEKLIMREEELLALRLKDSKGREILDPNDHRGFKNIYIDMVHKTAIEMTNSLKNESILLDFGCGAGRFCGWASKKVSLVIGLEIDLKLLSIGKSLYNYPNINYMLYGGKTIPFKDESIDIILCAGVLTKRELAQKAAENIISEFNRILKVGGKALVINKLYRRENIGYYQRKEMIEYFERRGFYCRYHFSIRKGHSLSGYLVKYGLIPQKHIPKVATLEVKMRKRQGEALLDYKDFIFEFEKIEKNS